jgi:hypothetical protein
MVLSRIRQQYRESVSGLYEGAGALRKGVTETITGARSYVGETTLGIADVAGQVTTGAITTVAPVTEGIQDAPGRVLGGVTAPVGQLSKDILPLAAVAAAFLLLRK